MDIYAAVTDRIIAQLEAGQIPWHKPWVASGQAVSRSTGKPSSLLNQLLLGQSGEYVTFKPAQQEGGHIRKGEKAQMVVFWKIIEQEDEETHEKKQVTCLRYYSVFHLSQCEGLTAKHIPPLPNTAHADQQAEAVIADYVQRSGVTIHHQDGDRACYHPSSDSITLPRIEQFTDTAEYYSTAFHELTHSTGHTSRLNRLDKTAFFGSDAYSKEELVAEIGAATLVQHVGLETPHSFTNSAAYIQSWLKALQNDKRLIVSAAGRAEKAVALILGSES